MSYTSYQSASLEGALDALREGKEVYRLEQMSVDDTIASLYSADGFLIAQEEEYEEAEDPIIKPTKK